MKQYTIEYGIEDFDGKLISDDRYDYIIYRKNAATAVRTFIADFYAESKGEKVRPHIFKVY